jgi:hypothetical protein
MKIRHPELRDQAPAVAHRSAAQARLDGLMMHAQERPHATANFQLRFLGMCVEIGMSVEMLIPRSTQK